MYFDAQRKPLRGLTGKEMQKTRICAIRKSGQRERQEEYLGL